MEARDDPPDPGAPRGAATPDPAVSASEDSQQPSEDKYVESSTTGDLAESEEAEGPMQGQQPTALQPTSAPTEPEDEQDNRGTTAAMQSEENQHSLSFGDVFDRLRTAITKDGMNHVKDEGIAKPLVEDMFSIVFGQHELKELPEEKAHYPQLLPDELSGLIRLFDIEVVQHDRTSQQWQRSLRELTASIYNRQNTLVEAIEVKESKLKLQHARNPDPWARNPLLKQASADLDEPMEEEQSNIVRFKTDLYSAEEISIMRNVFETPYDFPTELRASTEIEKKIVQGLLEGTILAQQLPQFLKRTSDNEILRVIQNTIHAQVEGELMFQLPGQFPVYPDFQTRDRLCNAMLQGAKRSGFDIEQLTQMLGETKQVCYNAQQHSVHLIYWTREAANKWSAIYKSVPFRHRRFLVVNAHPVDISGEGSATEQAARVWGRQVGRDGVLNERKQDRYKVKLLNVSRFIDEAGLDAFIRSKFHNAFTTFQEPSSGRQTFQTGAWEIYFLSAGCPAFLEGIRFINWIGSKILVHHVGSSPAPPCYNCGRSGHTVARCRAAADNWKTVSSCITVTPNSLASLHKQKSTVTSFGELEDMWNRLQEKQTVPEGPAGQPVGTFSTTVENQNQFETIVDQEVQSEWFSPTSRGRRAHSRRNQDVTADSTFETKGTALKADHHVIDLVSESGSQNDTSTETTTVTKTRPVSGPQRIFRPAALSKQQRLIMEAVSRQNPSPDWEATKQLQQLNIAELDQTKLTGHMLLESSGLHEVETPKTGNCQYYAMAMAMLSTDFSTAERAKAIENLTSKLKKGLQQALDHGFDEEYSHSERKLLLLATMKNTSSLSAKESTGLLREHLEDIVSSSSKRTTFLARSLWGSALTLQLAAKLLQRPIFVILARDGLEKAMYQVFEPQERTTETCTMETAGEFNFSKDESKVWLTRLQGECRSPRGKEHLPIVLQYGSQHYSWLQFGKENKNLMNNDEVTPEKIVERKSEGNQHFQQSRAEAISASDELVVQEQKPRGPTASMGESLETALKQPGLTEQDRLELQDMVDQGGPQKEDIVLFSTMGARGLAPSVKKMLVGLDWDDYPLVQLMQFMTGTDVATLRGWQMQLRDTDGVRATTHEDSDVEMDDPQDSPWSSPAASAGFSTEPDPPDIHQETPINMRRSRLTVHSKATITSRRGEQSQRDQWNGQVDDWKQMSSLVFPSLPAEANAWKNAVKAHPIKLLQALQTVDSPEFVLRSVNASILQDWTRQLRIDCLVQGLTELRDVQQDEQKKAKLTTEIEYLTVERDEMVNDSYIHGRDYWIGLRKFQPEKVALLKLCKKAQTAHLARLIVAAYAYAPEIATLGGYSFTAEATVQPLMKQLRDVLSHDAELHRAFYSQDQEGDLAALESKLAIRSMDTLGCPETMEQ